MKKHHLTDWEIRFIKNNPKFKDDILLKKSKDSEGIKKEKYTQLKLDI